MTTSVPVAPGRAATEQRESSLGTAKLGVVQMGGH